ncbi:MAG: M14 metallopeptidase family protein, partial [Pirellulaceae bacterium]
MKYLHRSVCATLLFLLLVPVTIQAQSDAQSPAAQSDDHWLLPLPEVQADPAIPDSKQALRYQWADDISSHYQVESYLKALADAAPDRAKLVRYGESYESRSLNYLVITSAENMTRLDEIRQNNLELAKAEIDPERASELIDSSPAIVWLAYCVHGNEISPSDAALITAYHLLADQSEETKQLLNDLVVIIDPLQNPDGRDRFVNVFRESRGMFAQSYPVANEHTERWPRGRSNHYWFDMNRDWFRHSQQEVRAKVAAYLDWDPQIYVDAHEMGSNSTFYFPPPTDPKNPFLLERQHEWFSDLGKYQASWFDKYGFGYMTREVFDAFYPGYGSEWPTLQGGLGILWEQASARGAVIDRDDETRLTYHDGVRNHYISGIATVKFAAAHRAELLQSFYEAKLDAVQLGISGPVKHYFLTADKPHRARELMAMLERNGIDVYTLDESLTSTCTDMHGEESTHLVQAGSFHIPVAQPGGRLLRALFDRNVEMDEKFLTRQLERNELRLPDEIYDVTAWSMPLAFDVECLSTASILPNIQHTEWSVETPRSLPATIPEATVAYLIPSTDGAVKMMSGLIQQGVRVHVTDESFTINDVEHERGTLIIKVADNDDNLLDVIRAAAEEHQVEVIPTNTAYVQEGAHMGGPKVHWVRPPEILIVVNSPTNYASGHTWYLFDQVLGYPSTRVKGSDFSRVDLSKFNTIVLPDGSYSEGDGFGESLAEKLSDWVRAGG